MEFNRFRQKQLIAASKRRVVSPTVNKIKPISQGGTRIVSDLDRNLAMIEMSLEVRETQSRLNNKADREWRASPNVYG